MKVLRTTTCASHGHPEFRVTYDPTAVVISSDAEWLLGWLQDSVAEGALYKPEQTCRIGWGVTQVRLHPSGDLCLWEPDMQSMPIEWVEGVTTTLAHLRAQKDVVESVLGGEELSFPSLEQSAIICSRLGRDSKVVMERAVREGADSGWYFGCQDDDHDHNDATELRRVSLYDVAARYAPQIVPYVALPPGVLVALGKGMPILFRDGEPLEFRPGSYLAARNAAL